MMTQRYLAIFSIMNTRLRLYLLPARLAFLADLLLLRGDVPQSRIGGFKRRIFGGLPAFPIYWESKPQG
jgi:hypothetical protein